MCPTFDFEPPLHHKVTNQLQSINSWIQNMNVYGEPHASLDYRVGDAEDIKSLFVQLLHAIGSLRTEGASHAVTLAPVAHQGNQTTPETTAM